MAIEDLVSGCAVCGRLFIIYDDEGFVHCDDCCLWFCEDHYPDHYCLSLGLKEIDEEVDDDVG